MISEKVIEFRDKLDDYIKAEFITFQEYIEDAMQISQHDYSNLSVLKFHVENENATNRDEALKFLNLLQDCYDGRSLNISVISSINDLYLGKDGNYTTYNTLKMLMQNAGISIGTVVEAWYEDDYFKQKSSGIVRNKDGSFSGKISSYSELQSFYTKLCSMYSYAFTTQRQRELEVKINFLADMDYSMPIIVCFANINSSKIKYTFFEEEVEEPVTDEIFLLMSGTEYKEAVYTTWAF